MSREQRTPAPEVGDRVRLVAGGDAQAAGVVRVFSDEGDRVLVSFDGESELRWCRVDEVAPDV